LGAGLRDHVASVHRTFLWCQTCTVIIAGWLFEGKNRGFGMSHGLGSVGVGFWAGETWMPRGVSLGGSVQELGEVATYGYLARARKKKGVSLSRAAR
jgi:hypothetical protein